MTTGGRLRDEERWFRTKHALVDLPLPDGCDIDWCRQWQGHCVFVELKQVTTDWRAFSVPVTQYLLLADLARLGLTLLVLHEDERIQQDSLLWIADVAELPSVDWRRRGLALSRATHFVPSTGAALCNGLASWNCAADGCACGGLFARSADNVCRVPYENVRDTNVSTCWDWRAAFHDALLHAS